MMYKPEKITADYPNASWWAIDIVEGTKRTPVATSESETSPRHPYLVEHNMRNDHLPHMTFPRMIIQDLMDVEDFERRKNSNLRMHVPEIKFDDADLSLEQRLENMVAKSASRMTEGSREAMCFSSGLNIGLFATRSSVNYHNAGPHDIIAMAYLPHCKTKLMWAYPVESAEARTQLYQTLQTHIQGQLPQITEALHAIETTQGDVQKRHVDALLSLVNGYPLPENTIAAKATDLVYGDDGNIQKIPGLVYLGLPNADGSMSDVLGKQPSLPHAISTPNWKQWMRVPNGRRFANASGDNNSALMTVIMGPKDFPGHEHVAVTIICDYDAHENGAPFMFAMPLSGDPYRNPLVAQEVIAHENHLAQNINDVTEALSKIVSGEDKNTATLNLIDLIRQKPAVNEAVLTQMVQARKGLMARLFDRISGKTDIASNDSQVERLTRQLNQLLEGKPATAETGQSLVRKMRSRMKNAAVAFKEKAQGKDSLIDSQRVDAAALSDHMRKTEAQVSGPISDLVRVAYGYKAKTTQFGKTDSDTILGRSYGLPTLKGTLSAMKLTKV